MSAAAAENMTSKDASTAGGGCTIDLSIVIVNWNTRDVLAACLRSVVDNLAGLRAEIFVVDNASMDGSQAMVREQYPEVRLIENTENRGFAPANNQALRLARGHHVLLLNSDTLVLGDVLAQSVRYVEAHPAVGVMGCRVLNEDRSLQRTCLRYPSVFNMFLMTAGVSNFKWPRFCGREHMIHWRRDNEREVDVVSGCYMVVRRAALDQVGLLDESFFFCGEEADWCRRFRAAGWQLRFAPVGEIIHIGNVSGQRRGHRRDIMLSEGLIRFLRKHEGRPSAALAWLLLWGFNASHFLAWRLIALLTRKAGARQRSAHFGAVTRDFALAWPKAAANVPAGAEARTTEGAK